eukprot:1515269-Rhodomonas_salina.1
MCGTELAYGVRCAVLNSRMVRAEGESRRRFAMEGAHRVLRASYATSGTDLGHAPARSEAI